MPTYLMTPPSEGFPPVEQAPGDQPLAIGGDLGLERLLLAYRSGIFPWETWKGRPVWWSPDPRFVLFPSEFKVPKSLARVVKQNRFTVTFDRAFRDVLDGCRSVPRKGQPGTWLSPDMVRAYVRLHKAGHAHSVEVWQKDELVGGLYGVVIGRYYSGESMFTRVTDASKVGFVTWMRRLQAEDFQLVDCQYHSDHLARFGARNIPRTEYLRLMHAAQAGE